MKNDSENITDESKDTNVVGERKTNNELLLAISLFCASLITKQACARAFLLVGGYTTP